VSTTTIRLPVELKSRIDKLASAAGKSSHAFMIDALAQIAESIEREREFDAEVNRRWARFLKTGKAIPWEEMRQYMLDKAAGRDVPRPKARPMSTIKDAAERA
jgi:predicted transcriptional regulator